MTSTTSEQLLSVFNEKLAPFKQTINQLRKSDKEANRFMQFTSKQYDMVKKVVVCEFVKILMPTICANVYMYLHCFCIPCMVLSYV